MVYQCVEFLIALHRDRVAHTAKHSAGHSSVIGQRDSLSISLSAG